MKEFRLPRSLAHWQEADFEAVFKEEVTGLDPHLLPLQEGLTHSSHALADDIELVVLRREAGEHEVRVTAGIFYKGIIAGCNCADDPSPVDEITEYCEVRFHIQRKDARTRVELL